jgi:alkyl hydroperoxide reductase subunit AhpC
MASLVGNLAPDAGADAYLRGHDGPTPLRLADRRGQWVTLFFYPRDFTFVCPTEIEAFARLQDAFAAEGAVVIGASTDSYYAHKAWYESDPRLAAVAFPVLADTTHAVSQAFGVLTADGAALRGTFLIDRDGIVRHASINDLDVGRNVDETLRLLRALKTGGLCPANWTPGSPTLSAAPVAPPNVSALPRVMDQTITPLLTAERAALVLARRDCGFCAAYEAEIVAAIGNGELPDFPIAMAVLDEPGLTGYKRDNPWLARVTDLPYTVLYRRGRIAGRFAGSRVELLRDRLMPRVSEDRAA